MIPWRNFSDKQFGIPVTILHFLKTGTTFVLYQIQHCKSNYKTRTYFHWIILSQFLFCFNQVNIEFTRSVERFGSHNSGFSIDFGQKVSDRWSLFSITTGGVYVECHCLLITTYIRPYDLSGAETIHFLTVNHIQNAISKTYGRKSFTYQDL